MFGIFGKRPAPVPEVVQEPPSPSADILGRPFEERRAAAFEYLCQLAAIRPTRVSELKQVCEIKFGKDVAHAIFSKHNVFSGRLRYFAPLLVTPQHFDRLKSAIGREFGTCQ